MRIVVVSVGKPRRSDLDKLHDEYAERIRIMSLHGISRDTWKRYEDLDIARLVLLRAWRDMQGEPAPGSAAEDDLVASLSRTAERLLGS